jgi:hypothetical protein
MSDLLWYEYPFYWSGLITPGMRFLGVMTIVHGIMLTSQPQFAFTRRGDFKSWKLYRADDPNATWLPWFVPGLVLGAASAIFI